MKIMTTDVYGDTHEAKVENLQVQMHVYGIAVDGDKVLISPQYDGYDWPGGTAEPDETVIQTLKREFREETGYTVEPVKLLNIYTSFFHHLKRKQDTKSYIVYYLVKVVDGKISTEEFDEDELEYAKPARWVKLEELEKMRLACNLDIGDELIQYAWEAMQE